MAVSISEAFDSRDFTIGQQSSLTLKYIVEGTDDEDVVLALIRGYVPVYHPTFLLYRDTIDAKYQGGETWFVDVRLGQRAGPEASAAGAVPDWSLTIAGGTQHITHSLDTIQSYASGGATPPNHHGAINVKQTGVTKTPEGVDIDVSTMGFSEKLYLPYASFTPAYLNMLFLARGRVNDATWRIWPKGSVLFSQVTGAPQGRNAVELTFDFLVEPSVTNLTVGDITGIAKEGWQYLWVEYVEIEDGDAKAIASNPLAVHIEKVREYADFTVFGLPDPFA